MRALRGLAILAAVLVVGLAPVGGQAQSLGVAQSDILVIDPERLFEESRLGQRMVREHQADREELAARNKVIETELEAEEQRLTDLRAETPPEEFRDMADAFDEKVQEIRRDSERRALALEREREQLSLVFLRRIEPVLIEIMREAGGVVLLDARTVLLRADAVDLTDRAIARIDTVVGDGRTGDSTDGNDDQARPLEEPADGSGAD